MTAYYVNDGSLFGHCFPDPFDPFMSVFGEVDRGRPLGSVSQSLVLDGQKDELVRASAGMGKKRVSEEKALAALKNHSEAERRRRERINTHLHTLRGLVPCKEKMDKATLLAEVIKEVKELQRIALEASEGSVIPMDADDVTVEVLNTETDGRSYFKASVCCGYKPDLLSDLQQALGTLQLEIVKAEMSTLEGRVKSEIVFTSCKQSQIDYAEHQEAMANSVHKALSSVLEKTYASTDYSPRSIFMNKSSVLEKACFSPDYSPRSIFMNKSSVLEKACVSPDYSPRSIFMNKSSVIEKACVSPDYSTGATFLNKKRRIPFPESSGSSS